MPSSGRRSRIALKLRFRVRRFGHWRPKSSGKICRPVEASSRTCRLKNGSVLGER